MNKESANIYIHSLRATRVPPVYHVRFLKLKELLGDMYEKYEKFKLVVNVYWDGAGFQNRHMNISGLDWVGIPKGTTPRILLPSKGGLNSFTSNNGVLFSKPSGSFVDLTLSFTELSDGQLYYMGTIVFFIFTIYGVEGKQIIPRTINNEMVNFLLHSNNATTNLNNNGGILTFNGVKIIEVLGGIYNKYDKFKIVLTGFINNNTNSVSNTLLAVKMRGLNWLGQYDYAIGNNNPYNDAPTLGFVNASSVSNTYQLTQSNWGCDFNKPSSNNANLIIYLYTVQNTVVFTDRNYGITTYLFTIHGVE